MKMPVSPLALLAGTVALCVTAAAAAPAPAFHMVRPIFGAIANNAPGHHAPRAPVTPLAQWNGSFTDHLNQTITYTMVGTDPSTTNTATTVPLVIIPLKFAY